MNLSRSVCLFPAPPCASSPNSHVIPVPQSVSELSKTMAKSSTSQSHNPEAHHSLAAVAFRTSSRSGRLGCIILNYSSSITSVRSPGSSPLQYTPYSHLPFQDMFRFLEALLLSLLIHFHAKVCNPKSIPIGGINQQRSHTNPPDLRVSLLISSWVSVSSSNRVPEFSTT